MNSKPTHPAGATQEIEHEIVSLFAELAAAVGFPPSYGQIYGLLYASAQPLSFTDIQERLGLSKGSVSQGLRTLREAKAIRPAEGADWRREHFEPETELRQLIAGFVADAVLPRIEQGARRVAAVKARVKAQGKPTPEQKVVSQRIEKLGTWHRKAATLLPLAIRFLG